MPATLRLDGYDGFVADLTHLPTTLRDLVKSAVLDAANHAESVIYAQYGEVTGNLRAGLGQDAPEETPTSIRVGLRSTAPHAMIYEYGTEQRQTKLGYARGRMPAAKVFVPTVMRERREMVRTIVALVEAEGLTVRGD